MPNVATRQLLRRHAVAFAVSFVSLAAVLVTVGAAKRVSAMIASGAPTETIIEVVLFSVPFTAALTIPMAVFLATLWVFTRLGKEGVLATARLERHGIRRLVAPVLGAATVVSALTLGLNSQVVPRANERLAAALNAGVAVHGDRTMTIGELQTAARAARANAGPNAPALAASYEVEIQKKSALAAASIVLALTGVALALLFSRGGIVVMIGAGYAVFGAYYACLVAGEALADRLVLSPFVAMWMANALFLAVASLIVWWRSRRPSAPRGTESLAIGA